MSQTRANSLTRTFDLHPARGSWQSKTWSHIDLCHCLSSESSAFAELLAAHADSPCRHTTPIPRLRLRGQSPTSSFPINGNHQAITSRLQLQCSMPLCNQSGSTICRSGDRYTGGAPPGQKIAPKGAIEYPCNIAFFAV